METMSSNGIRFLRQWEGFERDVYHDSAGLATIGVGHLLTKSELTSGKIRIRGQWVRYADGLTDQQINDLLAQDVERFEKAVRDGITVPLETHQFDALVSFAFNVGVRAASRSTLFKCINAGASKSAIEVQFLRWNRAGGRVVRGLSNRRAAEAKLFNDGNYS